ncbi:MAG: hypothetical protein KKB31_07505 [Nanoarchaeota archaeon]|nr:hypothetical protein [Nanoarchaeota archaeon]
MKIETAEEIQERINKQNAENQANADTEAEQETPTPTPPAAPVETRPKIATHDEIAEIIQSTREQGIKAGAMQKDVPKQYRLKHPACFFAKSTALQITLIHREQQIITNPNTHEVIQREVLPTNVNFDSNRFMTYDRRLADLLINHWAFGNIETGSYFGPDMEGDIIFWKEMHIVEEKPITTRERTLRKMTPTPEDSEFVLGAQGA